MSVWGGTNQYCTTLPGAAVVGPWGGDHDASKAVGKMFACFGTVQARRRVVISDEIIRSGLTKKLQASLPPREG